MALLRSLNRLGIFSDEDLESLLTGIPTVASELCQAASKCCAGLITQEEFVGRFGHLRPGSYNIVSPNYAQAVHRYFPAESQRPTIPDDELKRRLERAEETFSAKENRIETLLRQSGFQASAKELKTFIFRSIPARELAKFEFKFKL